MAWEAVLKVVGPAINNEYLLILLDHCFTTMIA